MSEESRTVLEFPLVDSLEDTDVVYLIRGTGVTRDKRILGSSIRTSFKRSDVLSATLAADTTVDLTLTTTRNVLAAFAGTTVADYTVTLTGTVPVVGQTTLIQNGSLGTITLAGALFLPAIPTILPGETCLLDWTAGGLAIATIGYSGAGFVNRLEKAVDELAAYPADGNSAIIAGEIPIVLNGVAMRIHARDVLGPSYEIPASGTYAMHLRDSVSADSLVTPGGQAGSASLNYLRGVPGVFRWRLAWRGNVPAASVVSSARYVVIELPRPATSTNESDKVISLLIDALVNSGTHWPTSVCIDFAGSTQVFKVAPAYTQPIATGLLGNATPLLQVCVLNPDGTPMTYAQLKTLIGALDPGFAFVLEGNS